MKKMIKLTPREMQVAQLVRRGFMNKQIGHELGIVEGTVKSIIRNALSKLKLSSRTQLAAYLADRDLEDMRRDRDHWRTRALIAEGSVVSDLVSTDSIAH